MNSHSSVPPGRGAGVLQRVVGLRRATGFVWRSAPRWTSVNVFLALVQGSLTFLSLLAIERLINIIGQATTGAEPFSAVLFWIAIAGGAAVASASCQSISGYIAEGQGHAVLDYMTRMVQKKALDADLEYYENAEYFNTMHRAQQEAPFRPVRIVQGLTGLLQSLATLGAIIGYLFSISPFIILIFLVAVPPFVALRTALVRHLYKANVEQTETQRQADYFNWLITLPDWAKEIRLFDLGGLFVSRYESARAKIRARRMKLAGQRTTTDIAAQSLMLLPVLFCYGLIARGAVDEVITIGTLSASFLALQRAQNTLQGALGGFVSLHEDNTFLRDLYAFLDLRPRLADPEQPSPVPRPLMQGVRFENVTFSYPLSGRVALENIDLEVKPGQIIALVGENGSGKTTLIKLLCRLYDPTEGRVTVDGIDLRGFAVRDWRREISVIFQDFARYALTLRENIAVGNVEAQSNGAVEIAAQKSGAAAVVGGLPQGYDTLLGRTFSGGQELSVGQWQKVALARAFLRPAQILVLDEPTSALDPAAEAEVFDAFRSLIGDQAAVMISHRLSTVKMADRIFVMEKGRIVESGTHDELIAQAGLYQRLFTQQARHYQ